MTGPATFPPDVVAAVCRHMDDDHAEDALLLCRVLGGVPDALSVSAVDVDGAAMVFLARTAAGERRVQVPFAAPVQERQQLRAAVVELSQRARREAGLPPDVRAHAQAPAAREA